MFGLIILAGFGVLALWALAYLVWVGRRERLEKAIRLTEARPAMLPPSRQSEQLAAAWRDKYLRGDCDVDEFEAGVARALRGQRGRVSGRKDESDREWLDMAHEERMRQAFTEPLRPGGVHFADD